MKNVNHEKEADLKKIKSLNYKVKSSIVSKSNIKISKLEDVVRSKSHDSLDLGYKMESSPHELLQNKEKQAFNDLQL